MKNVMFTDAPIPSMNRNAFDLSHEKKFSGNMGHLIPFMWIDTVPGDAFKIKSEVLVKFSPLLAPLLHRVDVYTHYFFVPFRLLMWDYSTTAGWEQFITKDPESEFTVEMIPYVDWTNSDKAYLNVGGLADYLGLPVQGSSGPTITNSLRVNCFPAFAYHLIYDEYYRDENLNSRITSRGSGPNPIDLVGGDHSSSISSIFPQVPHTAKYEKDYLRGALPDAYYGASSDVELDLDLYSGGTTTMDFDREGTSTDASGTASFVSGHLHDGTGYITWEDGASLGDAYATLEIMELRRAQAITKYLEALNRGGKRYPEMLLGLYGVISDNAQIQYPQYLGGGKQAVQISSIMNQSQVLDPTAGVNDGAGGVTVTIDPQSLETGRAMSVGKTNQATVYCKEHGIIMGIISVRPRSCYSGVVERFWHKADPEEFFVPQLQGIGDQEIYNAEAGVDFASGTHTGTWGYAPRWAEYKFKNSTVHGDFLESLDYWHMATLHDPTDSTPTLNSSFVSINQSSDELLRPFANQTSTDHRLYFQIYNDVLAIRPMRVHDFAR